MLDFLAYITWDVNPNIIEWPLMVRYYGVFWALSFVIGLFLMKKMMKNDNAPDSYTDKIFIYVMIGGVFGARLGHVVFYDPDYYFTSENWLEIFKIWKGGLASHGGFIGVCLMLLLYSKKVSKLPFYWGADKVVVTVAIAACLIRVGNLMNSEIIGTQSDSKIALFFKYEAQNKVIGYIDHASKGSLQVAEIDIIETGSDDKGPVGNMIVKVQSKSNIEESYLQGVSNSVKSILKSNFDAKEDHIAFYSDAKETSSVNANTGMFQFEVRIIPRIPTQIWEAFSYLIIFLVMMFGYWKKQWYKKEGLLFGLFLVLLFGARFIIEFWKEHQTLSDDAVLNMGQWLSIIPTIIGILIMYRAFKIPEKDTLVNIQNKNEND